MISETRYAASEEEPKKSLDSVVEGRCHEHYSVMGKARDAERPKVKVE
jgi:hypothetical protein